MKLIRGVAWKFAAAILLLTMGWFIGTHLVPSTVHAGKYTFTAPPGWSVSDKPGGLVAAVIRSPDGRVEVDIGAGISCGLPTGPTPASPGNPQVSGLDWDWCSRAFTYPLDGDTVFYVSGPIAAIRADHSDIQNILASRRSS
jgi:hypothetical protein